MKTVSVKASKDYDVVIGRGVLTQLDSVLHPDQKLAVISDRTVASYHLDRLLEHLDRSGNTVQVFRVDPGEQAKSMIMLTQILEWLAKQQMTRGDVLIALGGGVVGDLAGFAASIYLRGIPFIQIPTTFLAAIDSSVGGKTAIDLQAGKNLAGSFYQPSQVICDLDLLDTLPPEIFGEGTAEAIKYGIIGDPELFEIIASGALQEHLEEVIFRCVSMKRDIVERDEFDHGDRQLLNFGHTFGHGVEKLSNYQISHGHGVAIGMAMMARAAVSYGQLRKQDQRRIIETLVSCQLPVACDYSWREMLAAMQQDKKRRGDQITLVVPTGIGTATLHRVSLEEAGDYLRAGLQEEE